VIGFVTGVIAFIVALAIYATLVRSRRQAASATHLSLLLVLVSTAVIFASTALVSGAGAVEDWLFALVLAWSLSAAFIVANTAIESDSPTQSLALFLHQHRATGSSEEMIEAFIDSRPFHQSRLNALITDGAVERLGERLVCRSGGRLLMDSLDAYRRLIRRNETTG